MVIVEGLPEEVANPVSDREGQRQPAGLRRATIVLGAERSLVDMRWNVLIVGGAAISLLTASLYLVVIGRHAAFDIPRFKR